MPGRADRDLLPLAVSKALVCDAVTPLLAGVADGSVETTAAVRDHVGTCLRCQREVARYRRLIRTLHHLRGEIIEPPPGAVAGVLAALEEAGERGSIHSLLTGRRAAYAGGVAAVTAAATLVVWASRKRLNLAS